MAHDDCGGKLRFGRWRKKYGKFTNYFEKKILEMPNTNVNCVCV
jgi:hypothetical protein